MPLKEILMKKALKLLTVIISICLIIVALNACDTAKNPPDTDRSSESDTPHQSETQPEKKKYTFAENGKSEYKIIQSSSDSVDKNDAVRVINNKLQSTAKVKLEIGDSSKIGEKEILIGMTDRPESAELFATLKYADYVAAVVNGKLVVIGGCEAATFNAAAALVKKFDSDNITFEEGEILRYTNDYRVLSLKIGDNDISKYKIIYQRGKSSKYLAAAENLRKRIQTVYGVSLDIAAEKSAGNDAYEIIFGDCSADGYSKMPQNMKSNEYCIYTDGNKVYCDAKNGIALERGVDTFIKEYLGNNAEGNISLNFGNSAKASQVSLAKLDLTDGATMRVMTHNVLGSGLKERADIIVKAYLTFLPDVIGLQECNADGHNNIVNKLSEYYGCATGNIPGKSAKCYTPILYLKSKYKVVESGNKFFEKRYTKTNTKTMAWAVLEEIDTGKRFIVINSHFAIIVDSYNLAPMTNAVEGAQWREDNVREVLAKAEELKTKYGADTPLMVMGDLNSNKKAKSIQMLEEKLVNAIDAATVSKTTGTGTSHAVGVAPPSGKLPIDHILFDSATVNVYMHRIPSIADYRDILNISDHTPVLADISFK